MIYGISINLDGEKDDSPFLFIFLLSARDA